jgi:outer membrane protein assembly factor BamB
MSHFLFRYLFLIIILFSIIGAGSGCFAEIIVNDPLHSDDLSLAPQEVQNTYQDWPLANKDYSNTRNQQETDISSDTVGNLKLSWMYQITGHAAFGSAATTPIITNDTVYFQDLAGNIVALALKDGTPRWAKSYNSTTVLGPNGPAIGYGKVFLSPDGYSVSALDMRDGTERWSVRISPSNSTGINIQPVAYDKRVYIATVPGTSANDFYAGGQFGELYALDVETGTIIWNTSTIDTPDLWGNKSVNSGGGAWYSPAIDTRTGITYWGIGNPAPFPGTTDYPAGSSRPGPNLYTDSLMAVDGKDGEIIWYNQVKPHDLFDLDFQIAPVLAIIPDGSSDSKTREIVFGAGKLGKVYAFDRKDGSILWNTSVGIHNGNADLSTIPQGETIQVFPGFFGGVETPMAYADGMIFVPVVNFASNYTSTGLDPASLDFSTGTGELVALNAATGAVIWKKEYPGMTLGGATVASDIVFTATNDGTIYAYKVKTGDLVYQYKAPSGINGWPAIGKESIIWPTGATGNPVLLSLSLSSS